MTHPVSGTAQMQQNIRSLVRIERNYMKKFSDAFTKVMHLATTRSLYINFVKIAELKVL